MERDQLKKKRRKEILVSSSITHKQEILPWLRSSNPIWLNSVTVVKVKKSLLFLLALLIVVVYPNLNTILVFRKYDTEQ